MIFESDERDLVRLIGAVADTGYDFITPTPATIARIHARRGDAWARDLRDVFGWSLPFHPGTLPEGIEAAAEAAGVLVPAGEGRRSTIRISSLDGVSFVHSAYPTAAADSVFFGPDTYRFARALRQSLPGPVGRAVDIGCGSGAGAIVIARARPGAAVFAVDINETALRFTRANAAACGVTLDVRHSDLLGGVDGSFDLIVANPPYLVDPGERAYRHGGGPLGAELSLKIIGAAIDRLSPGGTLLLYSGAAIVEGVDPFREAATIPLREAGLAWTYEEIDPDIFAEELEGGAYARCDRIAAVLLTARKI